MTPRSAEGVAQGRRRWLAVALTAGVLAFAGCGDDDSTDSGTVSSTDDTPTGETTDTTTTSGEAGTDTTPAPSGGYGAGGGYDPEADTEDNDLPPPEGSEAEELEQQCEENPGACS